MTKKRKARRILCHCGERWLLGDLRAHLTWSDHTKEDLAEHIVYLLKKRERGKGR